MTADADLPGQGWYRDPAGRAELRWWDGKAWTSALSDGEDSRADLFGLPIAPPPGQSSMPPYVPPRRGASGGRDRAWVLPLSVATLAVALVVVIGLVLVVRQSNDRADDDAAARKELSDQIESLGGDVSDLSSHVDELSDGAFGFTSDFSFSDFSPSVDSCDVLQPEDVQAVLGLAVHVDPSYGFGYMCLLSTDDPASGTAITVRADSLYGDLRDEFGVIPGQIEPHRVEAGDEAWVASAYGLVMGVASKGQTFVAIEITTAGTAPTDEQMAALLVAAVAHL